MRWMWIDRIVSHEPGRRMVAVKNVSLAEDHLHDHFAAGADGPAAPVMPMSLIIEGVAQTAGILLGAVNGFREKVVLAKIVNATLDADVTPGQTLRYDAQLDRVDASGAAATATVERLDHSRPGSDWQLIGRVELMFSHVDHNRAGLEFPEENFVFGDNLKTILASAGLDTLLAER